MNNEYANDGENITNEEKDICLENKINDNKIILNDVPYELNWNKVFGMNLNVDLSNKTFKERLKIAQCLLVSNENNIQNFCEDFFLLPSHNIEDKFNFTPIQKQNYYVAIALFFILSKGHNPINYWEESCDIYESISSYKLTFSSDNVEIKKDNNSFNYFNASIRSNTKSLLIDMKSKDVNKVMENEYDVGKVKIFEMLWEVIVTKYGNYKPSLWLRKIYEYLSKEYKIRCEYKSKARNMFALSYEGKLDKPGHTECEDYSKAVMLNDKMWLIAVADGVGSCMFSSLGSKLAVESLEYCLSDLIKKASNSKSIKLFQKKNARLNWNKLMYDIQFSLASDLYKRWFNLVENTPEYANVNGDYSQFSSTLQFAFGCDKFVACGRLGDGSFVVRKKEFLNKSSISGVFMLNDGISGVTQSRVMTISNLKNNPSALQISFFKTCELEDILITSDGVSNWFGDNVSKTVNLMNKIDELDSFKSKYQFLSQIAILSSDYNETNNGSGDDSSLAYINFKKNNSRIRR